MDYPILKLDPSQYSEFNLALLHEIPDPPKHLWYQGQLPPDDLKLLAVVGSRKYTSYAQQVIDYLFTGLANYPIAIVSGLALGIDGLAHEAALKNNLYTLAVPGSGLNPKVLRPATNRHIAERILKAGGSLVSEFPPDTEAARWTFPQRNRIMAGLSHATLLIEAGAKSGTLITARLAVDYNRELLAVPGNIFSNNSYGTHQFIKLGATVITEPEDIIIALGLEPESQSEKIRPALSLTEAKVISLLNEPKDKDDLIRALGIPPGEANILLMQMEMQGYIAYHSPQYSSLI